uniref:Uncharacterized protein n=1 Tax=Arundo donax TaxID=35708 RepID=A0A0A9E0F7_ARUDO
MSDVRICSHMIKLHTDIRLLPNAYQRYRAPHWGAVPAPRPVPVPPRNPCTSQRPHRDLLHLKEEGKGVSPGCFSMVGERRRRVGDSKVWPAVLERGADWVRSGAGERMRRGKGGPS